MATDVKNDASLSTDLVSYWELEEASGTRYDSHGSNDLSDINTVTQGTGKQGNCADFEASNTEYLRISSNSSLKPASGSISLWINFESVPAAEKFIFDTGDAGGTLNLAVNSSKKFYGRTEYGVSGGTQKTATYTGLTVATATWYHVVYTYGPTAVYLYVNGSQVASSTFASLGDAYARASTYVTLGNYGNGGAYCIDGLIDEVGLWSRQISADDVTALYNSGDGIPYEAGAGASGPASLKTRDTIAKASIKTIDGIAIASVKTLDTIT